ncbi:MULTISPECIES: YceI family protein [unclassified Paracoccus (in: a-proteobacteria)]|uniref:YceI family protein n=1 Tax=unclassified Paracoccus (in: a-proteobacteria) TaxID=2688777 RepID=UPI000225F3F8|nr:MULTISPECIES: YceI family protein [unclassified Paracoccus (in: a-proteobacteria)]SMG48829.1 Polyisoprenoid-binding protein YceI [Paracoccus sp. J56]
MIRASLIAIALWAGPAAAQEVTPDSIPRGQQDYHAASAGTYRLDPAHTAVQTRVPHMGFSVSVFRFGSVSGQLEWNPDDPAQNRLEAEVEIASLSTPVEGFAEILTGPDYLDSAKNPTARFAADGFTADSLTAGKVQGQLTLLGKTLPATFDVTLIGAGKGFTGDEAGNPIIRDLIGVHAETQIDPQAYGMSPFFTDPITIEVDAEFARQE